MVLGHSGCPKTIRASEDLCRFETYNECVQRDFQPLPHVEDTLAQLTGAQVFTKLDANSSFWQISLASKSCMLTTFITPFGRYCFHKLPFEITSAPELFQCQMNSMLSGLPGILCLMDIVVVFGKYQSEHDAHLEAVLKQSSSLALYDPTVIQSIQRCQQMCPLLDWVQ